MYHVAIERNGSRDTMFGFEAENDLIAIECSGLYASWYAPCTLILSKCMDGLLYLLSVSGRP